MSKSKKRKSSSAKANPPRSAASPASKRSWLLWAGLAAVALLAIVAVLAWQGNRSAAPDTASGGAPNLQVDQTNIDLGDVPVNQMVKASFKLSNTGDGPLTVVAPPVPEVVEGCWPPRIVVGSTTLQPGQETNLSMEFTMHAGMEGPHDFKVVLASNDPDEPAKELRVLSNWVQ